MLLIARSYVEVVQRLGIRPATCGEGRVTLLTTAAHSNPDVLGPLSELAMAEAYATACTGKRLEPLTRLRIGLIVLRPRWDGEIAAESRATPLAGRRWILDCEIRDEQERLLSVACAVVDAEDER